MRSNDELKFGLAALALALSALSAQAAPWLQFSAPGAATTQPVAINGRSEIAGIAQVSTSAHGFLRTPDGTITVFDAPGTTLTRSELEERFLELCRDHGLPRPRVNHHVEGRERDFVFPGHRLVVETDGWRHHHSREAFEQDRLRDAELARAGYRTLRFTHRRLAEAPGEVAATVGAVLRSPARSSA